MNRIIFKESGKHYLCFDILLYIIIVIIGFIILFNECFEKNILLYLYSIFYIIGIASLIIYFLNRTENDYEHLIFTVINVLVGTFALLNFNFRDEYIILSLSILIYTISNTVNKGYYAMILNENKDANVVAKASITFLLAILGLFTSINFYFRNLIENEFLGYFFIAFGLISLLEPFMKILIKNNFINGYLVEDYKEKESKNNKLTIKTKVKPIKKKEVVKKKTLKKKNSVKK